MPFETKANVSFILDSRFSILSKQSLNVDQTPFLGLRKRRNNIRNSANLMNVKMRHSKTNRQTNKVTDTKRYTAR